MLLLLAVLLPIFITAQTNLKKIRQSSWQTLAYRITAKEAELFLRWDSIPLNRMHQREPAHIFTNGYVDEALLPIGNYVLVYTNEHHLHAELIGVTNLIPLAINNQQRLQVAVRTKAGLAVNNASVFVNNREATYNPAAQTWWVKNKKTEEALVKIITPGDTLFTQLENLDNLSRTLPQQRWNNFKSSRVYKILHFVPKKIKLIGRPRKYKSTNLGATGFILFSQAKYKPLDTVKLKGYVVKKNWSVYKKPVDGYLTYFHRGKNEVQFLSTIAPTTNGSYITSFVLADSIPVDINCNLVFKTRGKKELLRENFRIEDYLPDEIVSYNFQSDKQLYYRNETLRFSASAKDANGLPVMDATARLVLTTQSIGQFYQDTIFIRDTIYSKEIKLLPEGDTKFTVPANSFPKAELGLRAILIFKNSNNELQEKSVTISYKYHSREIIVTRHADSVKAAFIEDGISKNKSGEMEINDETGVAIAYPCSFKIDPMATEYSFYTTEENVKDVLVAYHEINNDYQVQLNRVSQRDTLGFTLSNPYQIPVYFTVFAGSKIIATGNQATPQVTWKKKVANPRTLYKVRWQYHWAGKENHREENIGLLYKLLNIQINARETVFPAQEEHVAIDVTDYKGNPASGVNLTAVSYNNQLSKDIRVKEPPYLARYKQRHYLRREGAEPDYETPFSLDKKYLLGNYTEWMPTLGIDTMPYYRLLFPRDGFYDATTLVDNFIPQVSVSVMEKGVPQEVYLLYLNRELVYYNGVTSKMKYAFPVYPGKIQLGIRLKDQYIEIDSFYIQPNYKHDLSFDIHQLPPHARITKTTPYWSVTEINLLERSLWRMENNYLDKEALVWQDNRLVQLTGNGDHIVGPFRQNTLQFFNPGKFDITFAFEPGFRYRLSKQVARLEKMALFSITTKPNYLPLVSKPVLQLGDTLVAPPEISYPPAKKELVLLLSKNEQQFRPYAPKMSGTAALQFTTIKDTVLRYVILVPEDSTQQPLVLNYGQHYKLHNLLPGNYTLLLVTSNGFTAASRPLNLWPNGTTCARMESVAFLPANRQVALLEQVAADSLLQKKQREAIRPATEPAGISAGYLAYTVETGGATVSIQVTDAAGKVPIPFVSIRFKGYPVAFTADASGNFTLGRVRPGRYTLVFVAVGYQEKEVTFNCLAGEMLRFNMLLNVSGQALNEVVVIGYGTSRKSSLTGSMATLRSEELSMNMLSGRLPGVQVTSNPGDPGSAASIRIRGINSITGDNNPLYVIDGILYNEMPAGFNMETAAINILSGAAATAIYGSRASNGVVVITTNANATRNAFRDYAFWQPELITDKNGQAGFNLRYPDNITGWRTFVVGMDKNRRMGKASIFTRATKPIVAQLSLPRFLVESDQTEVIGKQINYTADAYAITTNFEINNKATGRRQKTLLPNDAAIEETILAVNTEDTLKVAYRLQTSTGFKDEEQRAIPVYKKGLEVAIGDFWVLQQDTSVAFTAHQNTDDIHLYAQNNTLDLLLQELDQLNKYPYACMEQTASKLTGLAMEKIIRHQLKQPFGNAKAMDQLLRKIQQAQSFEGGWAWWGNGRSNVYITNYITRALLQFRDNPLVAASIRNALLYLHNQLSGLTSNELLTTLATLSDGAHSMDYSAWINTIPFDSLSQHQQWYWVKIKQRQSMPYQQALQYLVNKQQDNLLGSIHWGSENYTWHSNHIATTVVAFEVLSAEPPYKHLLPGILQYFLEQRRGGGWNNTVESATIIHTILPHLLQQQAGFTTPATIQVSGDTSFVINRFPYQATLRTGNLKNLSFKKQGGGLVYFTAYQNTFQSNPQPNVKNFIVQTQFIKQGQLLAALKSGERVTMQVSVEALKEAEFVMMEIPIPAGCTYVRSTKTASNVFQELYKNKVLLFVESLPKGIHHFEFELEVRYNGNYTVNPARAALMYFPVWYGNNAVKRIVIEK